MENIFATFNAMDVGKHIEKKGKFSYLSWPYAVAELRKADPSATWEVVRFDGKPFLATECGYFVEVAVTVQGVTLSQIHPVLDNNNRPIKQPDSFHINTSIQRCLVKAIALHGLGLYIYAGEDLPGDDKPAEKLTVTYADIEQQIRDCKDEAELNQVWLANVKSLSPSQKERLTAVAKEVKAGLPL